MSESLPTQSVVEWLDAAARRFCDRPAVEDAVGRAVSFGEFARLSHGVRHALAAAGVGAGDRVGVFMRKSIDTVVVFQGILRAGAAYVPADPLAPPSRAAAMFHDCHAAAIVVDEQMAPGLRAEVDQLGWATSILVVPAAPADGRQWRIESLIHTVAPGTVPRTRDDLAFLLYTSGSTGRPKAVRLTHGNVITFVDWCSREFSPTEQDKFATHAPLQFSLSVFNLYVAWKHGGTVVLVDEQTARIPQLVGPLIADRAITVWFSTPTILTLLAQSGVLPSLSLDSLRLVMFAGEPFPIPQLRSLKAQLPHPRYVHILGSTETHMMARCDVPHVIAADRTTPIPIGRICEHFASRIVADDGGDAESGTDGELCLSGPAVTPGYWNPQDNARAFFADADGRTWYRTGDIVREQPDGELMYRGRRDRMVKKRGNRIELAEIEACLYRNPGVKEAAIVAVPHEESGVEVRAFVVPSEAGRPTIIDLKAHCARSLPSYMVPDLFAFCQALPRTPTGKVDLVRLSQTVQPCPEVTHAQQG